MNLFCQSCPWSSGNGTLYRGCPQPGGIFCCVYCLQPHTEGAAAPRCPFRQLGCRSCPHACSHFPSPRERVAANHPWGFAFHFPSATEPPDSPPLMKMFYNTADRIQTTDMLYNREHKQSRWLQPGPALGCSIKSTFSSVLLKYVMKKENNLVKCSCSTSPLSYPSTL